MGKKTFISMHRPKGTMNLVDKNTFENHSINGIVTNISIIHVKKQMK